VAFKTSTFLAQAGTGRKLVAYRKNQRVFSQGEDCTGMYYIQKGRVKVSVSSKQGKEAVVAILGTGDFLGEGCLAGQTHAITSATTMEETRVLLIERDVFQYTLHSEQTFADFFLRYILSRNIHFEEDLIDLLFNSSEKRLARLLLLMARYGKTDEPEPTIPKISQETLAEMVGTTRSRINKFMNKFRDLGFIAYDGRITVHRSLLNVVLHEGTPAALSSKSKK
jgi:CRP/FNR family transcriptional regulator, cyclic AMP receptor protein